MRLFDFIKKKFVTMYCHMNVKFPMMATPFCFNESRDMKLRKINVGSGLCVQVNLETAHLISRERQLRWQKSLASLCDEDKQCTVWLEYH